MKHSDSRARQSWLEFYPPALEAELSPARWSSRCLLWCLVSLTVLALIWLFFARVDITVSAQGTIRPPGQLQEIKPLEKGLVSKVFVKEGQQVKKGQLLYRLKHPEILARLKQLKERQKMIVSSFARSQYLAQLIERYSQNKQVKPQRHILQQFIHNDSEQPEEELKNQAFLHLQSQWREYHSGLQDKLLNKESFSHRLKQSEISIGAYRESLAILKTRYQAIETLWQKQLAPELEKLAIKQQLLDEKSKLKAEQQQYQWLLGQRQLASEQLQFYRHNKKNEVDNKLEKLLLEKQAVTTEINILEEKTRQRFLRAPTDGVVNQVLVSSNEAVVASGETLMTLVPSGELLEVEAIIANRDIGYIEPGMPVELKVETFPFTRFGTISTTVNAISKDAVVDKERGPVYRLSVLLQSQHLEFRHQRKKLQPGMQVTAEVKTGKRRLLSFFLSPLVRAARESLHER